MRGGGGEGDSGGSISSNSGHGNSGCPSKCGTCGKMHKTEKKIELERNKGNTQTVGKVDIFE